MCRQKVWLSLLRAAVVLIISISQGHAAVSSLSSKTYTLFFGNTKVRFYIDATGRVFQYVSDASGPCGAVGSFTKLNASNRGQFSCHTSTKVGTIIVYYTASARVSGSTIAYDLVMNVRSTSGASLPPLTFSWVFSTDGARCNAISYLLNNQSFPPVACQVSAGHP
jgi:hypothetical protein